MPEKSQEPGKYGARGIRGHEAVARQLEKLVGYIASPITSARGLAARLRYLTATDRRLAAAREAGLDVTPRTLKAWKAGMRQPNKRSLQRIEQAYRQVRRENVVRDLIRKLNRDGRGTVVEIHPLNQSQVSRPRQRPVEFRRLTVRNWDRIVQAWGAGDDTAMDEAWTDAIVDLGSQWGQYDLVTNVGFSA